MYLCYNLLPGVVSFSIGSLKDAALVSGMVQIQNTGKWQGFESGLTGRGQHPKYSTHLYVTLPTKETKIGAKLRPNIWNYLYHCNICARCSAVLP